MAHDNAHRIQLDRVDRVAFYGRTLAEYLRIFDLDLPSWLGCTILDCPAGASSFVAEAGRQGVEAVACDPLYGSDVGRLIERGEADIQHVIERVARVPHLFQWDFYASVDALQACRAMALGQYDHIADRFSAIRTRLLPKEVEYLALLLDPLTDGGTILDLDVALEIPLRRTLPLVVTVLWVSMGQKRCWRSPANSYQGTAGFTI